MCVFVEFLCKVPLSDFIQMSAMRKLDFLLHSIASSSRNKVEPEQRKREKRKNWKKKRINRFILDSLLFMEL